MSFFTRGKKVDVSRSGAGGFAADEYPSLQKHFTKKNSRLIEAPKAISEAFLADFPNGEFYTMETSGENNWCGLHAIRNSMLAYLRQNPLVHVSAPTLPELLKALKHATKEFKKWSKEFPGYKVPRNFFNGDELRKIFEAWAFKLGGLDRNRWGGVQLGFITASESVEGVKQLPLVLNRQLEILESESRLPILRIWIFHNGNEHWEGIDQGPREEAKQMLPQLNHHQPEMRPSTHTLPVGQSTLPAWGIQPQQYPQQPQLATPSLDWNPPWPLFEYTPVPAPSRTEQPQFDLDYSIDLNYELDSPSGESYQPLLSPFSQPELYQPSLSLTPELQVKSLRGGCPLLDIQSGMYATREPPPPSTSALLDLGVGQDFPPTWMTPLSPIPCPLPPTPHLPAPPNSFLFPGQVPLEEPGWTFPVSPSLSAPYTQPMSQEEMEQQAWRQLEVIMAGLGGQLLGGGQAPIPHVQPPMPRAAPKRRMLSEVKDDKGQEEERPAKKRRK